MASLGEYWWWVPVVFVALGAFMSGYLRPRKNGAPHATTHGAWMIDSKVAGDVLAQLTEHVIVTRRLAEAAEGLLEVERGRDKRKSQERHDAALVSKIEALQKEIGDLKRGK